MYHDKKNLINECFKLLLENKSIDKITVKEISNQCGINRQTFYYHFSDIYELMRWSLQQDINGFLSSYNHLEFSWQDNIDKIYSFIYSKKKILLNAYDEQNRVYYELLLYDTFYPLVKRAVEESGEYPNTPLDKVDFVIDIYSKGFTNLFLVWLSSGMKNENYIQLENYYVLIDGSLDHVLKKFKHNVSGD